MATVEKHKAKKVKLYMDNSATSFPKPAAVTKAMVRFADRCGASAGRGAYAEARACEQMLARCRQRIARLINAEGPECIVFTLNCSHGLNIVIRGLLNTARKAHAIATAMDHNSVLRPLNALVEQTGLRTTLVPCDGRTALMDGDDVRRSIRPDTKLIALAHVSNVTGTVQPVGEVAAIARQAGVPCLIDAAQSAGRIPIDVQRLGADFIAFAGHKGLLGPLGTGVLYVRPGAEDMMPTMHEGGTGTVSESATQPTGMPDKYEVGSHNAIGIAGLSEAVAWLLGRGVAKLHEHALANCRRFLTAVEGVDGLTVYGPSLAQLAHRSDVFSVRVAGYTPYELAEALERQFGIRTRPGLHCAPLAHKTIGTYPEGTTRLSFGPFTTAGDVALAAKALAALAATSRVRAPGR
ncbi:MAG: aminotransferase class V-fold PLP-dependent enzyme [Planctomycetes bacterium]|nr:aminotransferase class V-fold PLP-dependent enzyme [Planctomycetota bacterium]